MGLFSNSNHYRQFQNNTLNSYPRRKTILIFHFVTNNVFLHMSKIWAQLNIALNTKMFLACKIYRCTSVSLKYFFLLHIQNLLYVNIESTGNNPCMNYNSILQQIMFGNRRIQLNVLSSIQTILIWQENEQIVSKISIYHIIKE